MTIKVNLPSVMVEMANEVKTPACTMGVNIALKCLERIAARACELDDPVLLKELLTLNLVSEG